MAFDKKIAAESAAVLPDTHSVIRQIFASLGTPEARESDILRMAQRFGIALSDLSIHCEKLPSGMLRLAYVH